MKYIIRADITTLLTKLITKLDYFFYGTLTIVMIYTLIIYRINGEVFTLPFCIGEVLIITILFGLLYYQISYRSNVVNNTVTELDFISDFLTIRTPPFKVLFLVNKPLIEVNIKRSEIRITKLPYPVKEVYDLDGFVYVIKYKNSEFYVLTDYFDKDLENELTKIYELPIVFK